MLRKTIENHMVLEYHSKSSQAYYQNTYLKKDILLVADVFETFRNTNLEHYKLDPAHFYTALGLAWQALFNVASLSMKENVNYKLFLALGLGYLEK